jgi:hypothetical protein
LFFVVANKKQTMFRYSSEFPTDYKQYGLHDYCNPATLLSEWFSIGKQIYVFRGETSRYEFYVREDGIIKAITYYSMHTGKVEIDAFGKVLYKNL